MLFVFYAIVVKFHNTVYGKLPNKRGTRELTDDAYLYGEQYLSMQHMCLLFVILGTLFSQLNIPRGHCLSVVYENAKRLS